MNELTAHIRARMVAARASLRAAETVGDDYLVGVREGELDTLAHLADAHGIDVDDLEAAELGAVAGGAAMPVTVALPVTIELPRTVELRTQLTAREPA